MSLFLLNPQLFNQTLYKRLLNLWFSDLPTSASAPTPTQLSKWFGIGATPPFKAAFDEDCTSTALPALQSIGPEKFPLPDFISPEQDKQNYFQIAEPFTGQFNGPPDEGVPKNNEEAALGLVLLLDQMPRNIFRTNQSLIYTHYDRISRAVAYAIYDAPLSIYSSCFSVDTCSNYVDSPPYRMWFYLPLMHSEALSDHDLISEKLKEMKRGAEKRGDDMGREYVGTLVDFEKRHRVILDRFGRYPHRNGVMGREDTEEERKWLREGGDTFGTG
ncbi:MAG: hypothetical protein Q9213_008049 [Squamulea squamosa]